MSNTDVMDAERNAVLAYLDGLSDEAAAHIFPSDLEKCQTSECSVEVCSVRAGNPDEHTVPLFSREQVVDALAALRPSTAPAAPMPQATLDYKNMFEAAISALAEIDGLLGIPEDGCNDPQVTVSALKDFIANRNDWIDAQYQATAPAAVAEPVATVYTQGDVQWTAEEIEAVICCLDDDAAAMLNENEEDERAHNMQRAATMIQVFSATAPSVSGSLGGVTVPDELKHLEDCQRQYEYGDSASMGYRDGWNDCRDEMLHNMRK